MVRLDNYVSIQSWNMVLQFYECTSTNVYQYFPSDGVLYSRQTVFFGEQGGFCHVLK